MSRIEQIFDFIGKAILIAAAAWIIFYIVYVSITVAVDCNIEAGPCIEEVSRP